MRPTTDDFEEWASARMPQLYRTAWLLAGDRHHAEDLVQETLAKMFRAWHGLRLAVLTRTFISQRRRRSWTEQPTSTVSDKIEQPADLDLQLALQSELAELAPLDRAVLVLRFFEDRSVAQVAADLGRSTGSIKNRTSRALDRLRAILGDAAIGLISV